MRKTGEFADMNQELLGLLEVITGEEQRLLDGNNDVQKNLYATTDEFVIDSRLMLASGKVIDIRPHTRFVHFPKHKHNYVEIIYMCSGSTTHIINDTKKVNLNAGELLFLNQNVTQEILPAGKDDIAVNFIVLPEFFDRTFAMASEENILRNFIIASLKQEKSMVDYLHFPVKEILPIQNLVENMTWALLNKQSNKRNIIQTTMELLMLHLFDHTEKINQNDPRQFEQNLVFATFQYIENHYKNASLEELSHLLGHPPYYVSKLLKKHSGYHFKNLLQAKRLNQSVFLLTTTSIAVENIIAMVGYENTSYFHRIFKKRFAMTPKQYRLENPL